MGTLLRRFFTPSGAVVGGVVRRSRWPTAAFFLLWLAVVLGGLHLLWTFSLTPGPRPIAASAWPAGSTLAAPSARPMLVMFLHPKCPCSRASLEELSTLLAQSHGALDVQVIFSTYGDAPLTDVESSSLWQTARTFPGVATRIDSHGTEAARFHSATSGDCFLFDPAGKLTFRGGLTAARGHIGENPGVDAVAAIVNHQSPALSSTPVFGCPLAGPVAATP